MRLSEGIQVKSNLILTARERGKIVARREGHNIWLDIGREYLASIICYLNFTDPINPAPERNDRVRYMGLGLGGTRQTSMGVANSSPMTPAYSGSNSQDDISPGVSRIERPVRVTGGTDDWEHDSYADPSNRWLGQVQAPVYHPTVTQSVFKRLFSEFEVSYAPFLSVPLSEIALFTGLADVTAYNNAPLAYDTFDTISKTSAFSLEIDWAIRF